MITLLFFIVLNVLIGLTLLPTGVSAITYFIAKIVQEIESGLTLPVLYLQKNFLFIKYIKKYPTNGGNSNPFNQRRPCFRQYLLKSAEEEPGGMTKINYPGCKVNSDGVQSYYHKKE